MTSPVENGSLSNPDLAAAYADLRSRVIALARDLSPEQAAAMTPCCPEWSVKDVVAHLAGITTDILNGNTEGAATEPWADAQVTGRRDASMADVCDEWERNADPIDEILSAMGDQIDARFYLDAWTHEWDIRQATGAAAEPDLRFVQHAWELMMTRIEEKNGGPLTVDVDPFTLARMAMGRRSRDQISKTGLNPDGVVIWSPNAVDIIDPHQPSTDSQE